MDRIIEISSVFVDLFNSSAGSPVNGIDSPIPVQLQEITEDYIQKILTACCSQQGTGSLPGFQSSSTIGSSGLRVNEFKRSKYTCYLWFVLLITFIIFFLICVIIFSVSYCCFVIYTMIIIIGEQ